MQITHQSDDELSLSVIHNSSMINPKKHLQTIIDEKDSFDREGDVQSSDSNSGEKRLKPK